MLEILICNVDIVMYQVKVQGKNGYVEFQFLMNINYIECILLENDFWLVIE